MVPSGSWRSPRTRSAASRTDGSRSSPSLPERRAHRPRRRAGRGRLVHGAARPPARPRACGSHHGVRPASSRRAPGRRQRGRREQRLVHGSQRLAGAARRRSGSGPLVLTLLSILTLGFFLGMRHATDPDLVIAVATLVTRERTVWSAMRLGVLWALGHRSPSWSWASSSSCSASSFHRALAGAWNLRWPSCSSCSA